jgi:hypothetical protein
MKALTVWRPWSDAILYGGKRVENRSWPLPARLADTDQLIALHAGQYYDKGGAEWMRDMGLYDPPGPEASPQGVVGVFRISGVRREDYDDPWFFGPFGFMLQSVQRLERPIACRGGMKFWNLPDDVERWVRSTVVCCECGAAVGQHRCVVCGAFCCESCLKRG